MKPPAFEYVAAHSLDHALDVLARAGGDAKILAGGQSLMPMLNFRLVNPVILLDINRLPGLDQIDAGLDRMTLGALVRHRMIATDAVVHDRFPMLTHAMTYVAHHTVRNRGTFVGSLCHADPAAEMPMMALLLDAEIEIASLRGTRRMPARDFFIAPLTTALAPDEIVTAAHIPYIAADASWGFEEFARRHGDYALAAASVTLRRQDGAACDVRIAVMGVADTPVRIPQAEAMLERNDMTRLSLVLEAVRSAITPNSDLHASADYRRHLAGILVARALQTAWNRAK